MHLFKKAVLSMCLACTMLTPVTAMAGDIGYATFTGDTTEHIGPGIHQDIPVDIPITDIGGQPESSTPEEPQESVPQIGDSLGAFRLTAYCLCRRCNGNSDKIARIGTPLIPYHTIAVDPRVIPLGTWVYINIPGQGWQKFRAEDTGSGVKGNRIDVCLPEHGMCFNPIYNGTCEVRLALNAG